jgi:PIN domain nuclease of toxin-antitoxin system
MNLLLDSHAFIWWIDDDTRLGPKARLAIESAAKVFVSVISVWELGSKQAAGKLEINTDLAKAAQDSGFEILDCQLAHAQLAPTLPPHHKDPFDRMLLAQATIERLKIMSQDGAFTNYEIDLVSTAQ